MIDVIWHYVSVVPCLKKVFDEQKIVLQPLKKVLKSTKK